MGISSITVEGNTVGIIGTSGEDKINTYDYAGSYRKYGELDTRQQYWGYETYLVLGLDGDDTLEASIIGNRNASRSTGLSGMDGDDRFYFSVFDSTSSTLLIDGGKGCDVAFTTIASSGLPTTFNLTEDYVVFKAARGEDGSSIDIAITYETEWLQTNDRRIFLTEDLHNGVLRSVTFNEAFWRASGGNADWFTNETWTVDYYYIGTEVSESLYGSQGANGVAWANDVIEGGGGDDLLGGGGGKDFIYGGLGNDEIRAGYGHDMLSGQQGSDILYGGGGANDFLGEKDGSVDQLFIMSDFRGHGFEWGRNHNGNNSDWISSLDAFDQITILGTSTENLSVRESYSSSHGFNLLEVYDGGSLEVVYEGGDHTTAQLASRITGDPSRPW